MGELDLEAALRGRGALAEDLEDEPGPIDHFRLGPGLEIFLLDRCDRRVDDQQLGFAAGDLVRQLLDLAGSEQGRRPRLADAEMELLGDLDADRLGEAGGFVEPCLRVAAGLPAPPLAKIRESDDGAGAAAEILVRIAVEDAQAADSSSSASTRLTGCSG
jgi:hypothetical protein